MKVKADITFEIDQSDISDMGYGIGESLVDSLAREVREAIKESETWRDMKRAVYNVCMEKIREEIAKEFIDKIKGEQ